MFLLYIDGLTDILINRASPIIYYFAVLKDQDIVIRCHSACNSDSQLSVDLYRGLQYCVQVLVLHGKNNMSNDY